MVLSKEIMNPKSINIAVAEQIEKFSSDKVISTVVEKLVQVEVNQRRSIYFSYQIIRRYFS